MHAGTTLTGRHTVGFNLQQQDNTTRIYYKDSPVYDFTMFYYSRFIFLASGGLFTVG